MSAKQESKESEESLESNLDHEWEAVCASVIADGVLLIKDDGTYADGYLDHIVDGKESEPSNKKRSRRENDSEWNNNIIPKTEIQNLKPNRKRRSARIDEIFSTSGQKLPQALGFLPGTPTSVMSAKKSIKSPSESSIPKKVQKLQNTSSPKPKNPSRIGGLSNMCLDDRLNLRKVKMDQKNKMTNKAQISRTILNCMKTGQTVPVETELDRRLPKMPVLTSISVKKKAEIELELFEI